MKRLILIAVTLVVLGLGGWFGYRWYSQRSDPAAANYRLATVTRQDLVASISATGTLVPEDVVDIGAQVNGLIAAFGLDSEGKPVDYRSQVKADQTLARIDDAIYAAQVASDEASLAQARAAVRVAEATREQARARMDQAQRDWARAQKLGESQALSQADYDAARSNFDQSTASLAVSEAQIGQAQSQVAIAEAALQRSRRNLFYCTIKSPVDGVIIDRRVEIGQTVVSSLNAPSLFLIAKDLAKMLVLVQVNEADIRHVKAGDRAWFTVDAFPGERFQGDVRKVRLNATMTQNVVTYTVEIVTSNADLRLLPYLTANVRFVTDSRQNALTVPNAALRWSPPGADQASSGPTTSAPPAASSGSPGPRDQRAAPSGSRSKTNSRVWVLREDVPTPITVTTGLSDGTVTEIITEDLREGDSIVVGQAATSASASNATTNPFAPAPFGGRGGGGGGRPGGGGGGR